MPDAAEYTTSFAGRAVGAMDTSANRPIFGVTFAYVPNSGHAIYVRSSTLRIADLVTPPAAPPPP